MFDFSLQRRDFFLPGFKISPDNYSGPTRVIKNGDEYFEIMLKVNCN
jgi:hypothetical protein